MGTEGRAAKRRSTEGRCGNERCRSGSGNRRWLHAAQSYFHDIQPARALGLETAWVNRKGETAPDGDRPTFEVPDLTALAGAELEPTAAIG